MRLKIKSKINRFGDKQNAPNKNKRSANEEIIKDFHLVQKKNMLHFLDIVS